MAQVKIAGEALLPNNVPAEGVQIALAGSFPNDDHRQIKAVTTDDKGRYVFETNSVSEQAPGLWVYCCDPRFGRTTIFVRLTRSGEPRMPADVADTTLRLVVPGGTLA